MRAGRVPHSLHYQGAAQTARWRAVHDRWSPFVRRRDYQALFDSCFADVANATQGDLTVVGLGCGTGAKDVSLIERLLSPDLEVSYVPVDVSVPLVTTSALAAGARLGPDRIHPLIADLLQADNLNEWLAAEFLDPSRRLYTFFGMLPNFVPGTILPQIAGWLRPDDRLLLSVNLAPGADMEVGMASILSQYDNAETRSWLITFLEQGGVRADDGELAFSIEQSDDDQNIWRIVARWQFRRACRLHVLADAFDFSTGDELELFFSCRHRAESVVDHLERQGLRVAATWLAPDGEEAIYWCRAAGGP